VAGMPSPVPEWLLSAFALATVFTVMLDVGLGIVPGEFLWLWRRPALMLKALFAVLVAVPAVAMAVARLLDLPRAAEIGLMVMAISPGAPVALRRSLASGGHRSFAPGLQVTVALVAVVSMPVSIAALNQVYAGHASVGPLSLMKQVFIAQLLPLGLGVVADRYFPSGSVWLKARLDRIWKVLLCVLAVLALMGFWGALLAAGPWVATAACLTTAGAIAVGHGLGGPDPATRTAVAISSSARNPGLALLVVAVNGAPLGVRLAVLSYIVVSAATILPYVFWRRQQVTELVR
jgi:bile acid:Na+ symporter, BASS family